jgi:hypothetical protein
MLKGERVVRGTKLRRHTGLTGIVLLLAALALAGCVSVDIESDFDQEGGARHAMAITIDQSSFEGLGEELDPAEGLDELREQAAQEGFEVEAIEDGDIVGTRIIANVDDASNLGDDLNRMLNVGEDDTEDVFPFSGTFQKDGGVYTLELTVDGDELSGGASADLGGEDLGIGMEQILEMTYVVRLPGEIDELSGPGVELEDGRVEWQLPLEGTETLRVVSKTDEGSSFGWLLWVVLGLLLLAALGGLAYFLFSRGRKRSAATGPSNPDPAVAAYPAVGMMANEPATNPGTEPTVPTAPLSPDQPTAPLPPQPSPAPNPPLSVSPMDASSTTPDVSPGTTPGSSGNGGGGE